MCTFWREKTAQLTTEGKEESRIKTEPMRNYTYQLDPATSFSDLFWDKRHSICTSYEK